MLPINVTHLRDKGSEMKEFQLLFRANAQGCLLSLIPHTATISMAVWHTCVCENIAQGPGNYQVGTQCFQIVNIEYF